MTGYDDFDRTLADWFEAETLAPAPAGSLDRVSDAIHGRRPRPAWLAGPGSRWVGDTNDPGSRTGVRQGPRSGLNWNAALILLLVIATLVAGALLVGARLLQNAPVPLGRLGHLAYGLDGDIYVADWDGRNPVRVADGVPAPGGAGPGACGSYWGEGPMWSPDGRHFTYRNAWDADSCRATTGEGKVFVSDPAGHVVASFPGSGWLVSWSPDSTRVATILDLGRTFGIYGLDGVRQALLSVPPGYGVHGDYDPMWSPDGLSLLMPIAPIGSGSPSEIWELPINGDTPRRVPPEDPRSRLFSNSGASYSNDGARVAFIDWPDSESLVIAQADGTRLRVLAGAYHYPVVSPTGDRVAFVRSRAFDGPGSDPSTSIYELLGVVDVASGTVTTLASTSGGDQLGVPRFSPEGDRVLFSRDDSLWSVHADGSDAQLLVSGTGWGDWQTLAASP